MMIPVQTRLPRFRGTAWNARMQASSIQGDWSKSLVQIHGCMTQILLGNV